ncbi:RagB/SusD family nutrient uptake outer membrane protein [Sphingobacterium rhinopitheci]|uniref:RagB/SusD family nutrient uptake outer membrane protein n=1 Tax=Sphingobacterium rhinopitheci TaxID=2781960 RepID=UPI001F518B80|nr:RagB/SusD family nutrient uptake outer membrane protein [Sphingobacterium rhinopitheci]MCI0922467.1 RagB/SusD family nutrient uptake outer membrane protein [Sphingobacterium rhinopitheci]
MKNIFGFISICTLFLSSCELSELPQATATEEDIFGTESGLKTYSYSFYNNITSGSDAYKGDVMSDYGAVNSLNSFLMDGAYNAEVSSGWSWSALRNINHFIVKCEASPLSSNIKNNYIGVAKFFRAWFYYDKVVRFGDVPWVDSPLGVDDKDKLYGTRDPRTVVMDKIMEDLDFAYQNIQATSSDGTTITKWTALGLKSRVALFEGTFRKYHTDLGLAGTADVFLNYAADAAAEVMSKGPYSLNTDGGPTVSQRQLFISDIPVKSEVMLAVAFSNSLAILNDANWWWTSATYGPRFSLVRPFINTILNDDGTPYTSRANFQTEEFFEECQNRDARLAQLIRTPGYKRNNAAAPPNFSSYTYTGYQPIKYTLDDSYYDNGRSNTNAVPLMRYAEILLNYAEAKAELGTLAVDDWKKTIGALRARAGVTGGLDQLPTTVDAYLKNTFFPNINNPILLEVRRERQVELALEGFRFNDLKRWKRGELLAELPWQGIYVPALNKLIDLDHDGVNDVIFYDGAEQAPTVPTGVARVAIGGKSTNFQTLDATNHLEWFKTQKRTWYADGRQYLYPIPASAIVLNPNLIQNRDW